MNKDSFCTVCFRYVFRELWNYITDNRKISRQIEMIILWEVMNPIAGCRLFIMTAYIWTELFYIPWENKWPLQNNEKTNGFWQNWIFCDVVLIVTKNFIMKNAFTMEYTFHLAFYCSIFGCLLEYKWRDIRTYTHAYKFFQLLWNRWLIIMISCNVN